MRAGIETGARERTGRPAGSPPRGSAAAGVLALVSRERRVPERLLLHASRCREPVALARHLAMYLMHVMLGESLTDIGLMFGRDRTTVSHACGRIEDLRDRPRFDAEVSRLEERIEMLLKKGEELAELTHADH